MSADGTENGRDDTGRRRARRYCRVVDWSSLALVLLAVLAGGLYAVWVLGSVSLAFVAFIVAMVVVIGGAAFVLKVCIRRMM
ncbi:MAG: hypothetical protein R6U10_01025 [Thermoplasmatota archaeon]